MIVLALGIIIILINALAIAKPDLPAAQWAPKVSLAAGIIVLLL